MALGSNSFANRTEKKTCSAKVSPLLRSVPRCLPLTRGKQSHTASLASLGLVIFVVGCASPGPPTPPSLKLPQPVTDLAAQRVGDQVLLHWTTPTRTTDGLPIQGNLTARICRTPIVAAAAPVPRAGASLAPPLAPPLSTAAAPPCQTVNRVAVHAGSSSAADSLPAPLTANPVGLLDYRVEIENSAGRSAGPSNVASSAAGAAPAPVQSLHASGIPAGAMLEWDAAPSIAVGRPSAFIDIDRINPALVAPPKNSIKAKPAQPLQLAEQESAEVHLRSSGLATGTIDPTARFGQTYRYTVQRVVTIQLNGHPLELRGAPSPVISLTLLDTFPPAVPTGLATVLTTTPQPGIDISWQPDAEPDLAGYNVYRRAVATPGSQPTRLTPTPIPGSAYRDLTATPGQRYAYSVTAIDTSNNESKPSPETEETLPQP